MSDKATAIAQALASIPQSAQPISGGTESATQSTASTDLPTESTHITETANTATSGTTETKDDKLQSERIALIARREKALMDERAKLKAEMDAERAKLKSEMEPYSKYKDLADAIQKKEWKKLEEYGFDYNDYTKSVLNDMNPSTESLIQRAVGDLDKKLESRLAEMQEAQKKTHQDEFERQQSNLVNEWTNEARSFLVSDEKTEAPKYEWLHTHDDPGKLVIDVIQEVYKTSKRKLSFEEAADYANKHLRDEVSGRLKKIKSSSDIFLEQNGITKEEFESFMAMKNKNKMPSKPVGSNPFKSQPTTLSNNVTAAPQSQSQNRVFDKHKLLAESAKLIKFV